MFLLKYNLCLFINSILLINKQVESECFHENEIISALYNKAPPKHITYVNNTIKQKREALEIKYFSGRVRSNKVGN